MAESVLRITIDSRNAERNARNIANELQNIESNGNYASRSMDSMSVATRQLVGYMGGLVTVGAAISKMDTYTGLNNKLKLVTNSQAELNQALGDTFKIAQNTAQSWDSVAQIYQRFSDNAKTLNINQAQTAELTSTVSKAIAISGGSAASAEAALIQFSQALASNVLRGEELNSVMEQAPGLAKAIAQGMGITVGQLRSVAAEGKITGDVLVDALTKAKSSVDDLFSKTDFTIAQSFTQLSNEVTKFVGEAGKGSGAASALSGSITSLAKNLSLIADVAIIGGVAMLTKTILTQTVAIHGSIAASVARRAADTAALQLQIQLAAIEVQRTRQAVAMAATEINLARLERNSAITRAERAAATMRLTQAEIAHAIAQKQAIASTVAQTAAENTLNAARSRGAMLLGLVGGPIGAITLGVAALAAGYMYLKNRTAEANAKLEEQGKIAEKTDEELKKLSGNDKVSATKDLTAAFAAQNATLEKSKESVNAVLFAIRAVSVENERARKITEDARKGVISYDEAIKLLNNEKIPTDLYDELKKQAGQYDENAVKASKSQKALNIFGVEVKLSGNAAQNAASQINQNTDALDDNARAANAASKAHQDYLSKAQSQAFDDIYSTGLMNQGRTPAQAKAILDLQKAKGESAILSKEEIDQALRNLALTDANAAAEKKYADRISNRSKTQSDAARKAKQAQEQARREAEQLAEEQFNLREQLIYQNADREKQIELNLAKGIAEIRKAKFSDKDTKGLIGNAENQAELEKKLYVEQLKYELNEWQMTEQEKLDQKVYINELMIKSDRQMNDEFKDQALKSLMDRSNQELGYIKLAKEQRIFQAEQGMMTEMQFIQKRYSLEYDEISKIADLEERRRRLNALNTDVIRGGVGKNFSDPNDTSSQFLKSTSYAPVAESNTQRLDNEFAKEQAKMLANFEKTKELNAANHEAILEAERQFLDAKQQLQDEYDFKAQDARRMDYENQLSMYSSMISMSQGVWSELTSIVQNSSDENSKTYKTMFAIQKAMAIAQAIVSTELAATQVLADPTALTLAQKQLYAGMIRMTGYASIGVIAGQALAGPGGEGYKSGGYTGNIGVNQEAGVVHGQEYVLNAEATKRVGVNTLNAINNGGTIQAEKQAQANAKVQSQAPQIIDNQLRVLMVKDEQEAKDHLYGPDGEKAFLYHYKRNRSKL